jgi:hypothetical protein
MAERKKLKSMTCERCGRTFTHLIWPGSIPKYCSDECRRKAWKKKEIKPAKMKMTAESFGLEADPWQTGQLPISVRQNALWGQP